jgi:hypothetical protein
MGTHAESLPCGAVVCLPFPAALDCGGGSRAAHQASQAVLDCTVAHRDVVGQLAASSERHNGGFQPDGFHEVEPIGGRRRGCSDARPGSAAPQIGLGRVLVDIRIKCWLLSFSAFILVVDTLTTQLKAFCSRNAILSTRYPAGASEHVLR